MVVGTGGENDWVITCPRSLVAALGEFPAQLCFGRGLNRDERRLAEASARTGSTRVALAAGRARLQSCCCAGYFGARETHRQQFGAGCLEGAADSVGGARHSGPHQGQFAAERVDFTADISVLRTKVESDLRLRGRSLDDSSDSSNLGFANLGLRGKPSPRTEAWIKAGYIDGSDVDEGEFVGTLGGQVNFTPTWGLVGEVQFIDDANQYKAGVRASF